jgi:hypothetical protein
VAPKSPNGSLKSNIKKNQNQLRPSRRLYIPLNGEASFPMKQYDNKGTQIGFGQDLI